MKDKTNKYKITFQTWNKVAKLYQEKFMDLDLYIDTYDAFCDKIPKRGRVLEIGCGPGNITKHILNKRSDLQILATDIAPNMINLAKKNNPAAEFQIMDCRELDKLSVQFEAILCGFCLPYLAKEDCVNLIKDSFDSLTRNGIFYLSTIEGDYEKSAFQIGSTGDKAFVYYYNADYLVNQLKKHGFKDVQVIKKSFPRGEEIEVHLILLARKN